MFLSSRATQAEYFDALDRPATEIAESYASLARLNRLFIFAEPFQRLLPRMLGHEKCASLSFLDLGAGDGSLGIELSRWAAKRGWTWRFVNLDLSPPALRLSRGERNVVGSVLELPFRDASIDVVVASQMTHHLPEDAQVVRHLREAWRVARRAILLTDLHRGLLPYALLRVLFFARSYPKHFRDDALLSIRRSFRPDELQLLAEQAGIKGARASLYHGSRVILQSAR
jgi:SAM-dependent methyltransferase